MTLGWINLLYDFSFGFFDCTLSSFLLKLEGRLLKYFDKYKKSNFNYSKGFINIFYTNKLGENLGLINSNLLNLNCSIESWEELVSNECKETEYYFV